MFRKKATELLKKSIDGCTGVPLPADSYTLTLEENTLLFRHPGLLTSTVEIDYWVNIPAGHSLKYTNRADILYEEDGGTYISHRNYVLESSDYSASLGEKHVDQIHVLPDGNQVVTCRV